MQELKTRYDEEIMKLQNEVKMLKKSRVGELE